MLYDFVAEIEAAPTFGPPTEAEIQAFAVNLDETKELHHKTDRTTMEVSVDLDMRVKDLEDMVKGKSVLDVGCGEGKFANDIARVKRTSVVALDVDPEMVDRVRQGPRLRAVQGDGHDLRAAVGDEQFDVVVMSYSSYSWADTPDKKIRAIESGLEVCAVGGLVIVLPIIQNVTLRRYAAELVASGDPRFDPTEIEKNRGVLKTINWGEARAFRMLEAGEAAGRLGLAFVSSGRNKYMTSYVSVPMGTDTKEETYSTIITKRAP